MPHSIEKQITLRFLQVMADHVGPGKKHRFKNAFAKSIGMLPQELHLLESGRIVRLRHILAIHKATGVKFHWLFTGKGDQYEGKNIITTDARIEYILQEVAKLRGN